MRFGIILRPELNILRPELNILFEAYVKVKACFKYVN